MGSFNEDELETWNRLQPGRRVPGSAEPMEDRCGIQLHNKGMREAGIKCKRYCTNKKGARTTHEGFGPCSKHLGCTRNIRKKYDPMAMEVELPTLAERLNEPIGLDPAPVEAERILRKIKNIAKIMEEEVSKAHASGGLWVTSRDNIIHAHPALEAMERNLDRVQAAVQFFLKFDLEERRLELIDRQAKALGSVVLGVILDPSLGLTDDQVIIARANLSKALQKLAPKLEPAWAKELANPEPDTIDAEVVEEDEDQA